MAYFAKVVLDSVSSQGARLTTMEVSFPRIVLAEFNTHRMFSRNSASSRAIPVEKMIARVLDDPFVPMIVTATEWSNFFALRRHPAAQPEIRRAADLMFDAMKASTPKPLDHGEWHMPYVGPEEMQGEFASSDAISGNFIERWCKVSVGRCARVSYLTHDGVRDPDKDVALAESLLKNGHMSPFEHVARPMSQRDIAFRRSGTASTIATSFLGNFRGWTQYRKGILGEEDFSLVGTP